MEINGLHNDILVDVFVSPSASGTIDLLAKEQNADAKTVVETLVSQHFIEMRDQWEASYSRLYLTVETEVFFSYFRDYATIGIASIMSGTGKSVAINVFVLASSETEKLEKAASQSIDASVDLGFIVFYFSDDGVIKWR